MKRTFKWALLVLILAEVLLVRFNLLDIRTAIGIVVAVELLLFLVAFRQVFVAVRTYKRDRQAGLDGWKALGNGLEVFMPRVVSSVVVSEFKLWFCLGIWLLRQSRPKENEFTYHKKSILRVFPLILLFTTPVEVFLMELLLPWAWLKWLLIILAIYGLFWVVGLYASMVVLPYRLDDSVVRLSYGILARAEIPYTDIMQVTSNRTPKGVWRDGLKVVKEEGTAYLAVSGSTNVVLTLRRPAVLQAWLGPTSPVCTIYLATDEPQRLIQEVGKKVTISQGS